MKFPQRQLFLSKTLRTKIFYAKKNILLKKGVTATVTAEDIVVGCLNDRLGRIEKQWDEITTKLDHYVFSETKTRSNRPFGYGKMAVL